MANNLNVRDALGATKTLKTTDNISVHTPHHNIDSPLGRAADAASLSAALSTEDVALVGSLTETAPTTDTASSGLNGRLQRFAQRITSLIALLPTALGQGTMATSLKVVLPSDQSSIPVASTVADGANVVEGTTTVAAASSTVAEDTSCLAPTVAEVLSATSEVFGASL
mgnify:CR=1 FL=1